MSYSAAKSLPSSGNNQNEKAIPALHMRMVNHIKSIGQAEEMDWWLLEAYEYKLGMEHPIHSET